MPKLEDCTIIPFDRELDETHLEWIGNELDVVAIDFILFPDGIVCKGETKTKEFFEKAIKKILEEMPDFD